MILKKLNPAETEFIANGKKYKIETSLSIERFCEFQILEKEFGYSMDFKKLFNELLDLRKLMNELKFVDSAVKLENLTKGIAMLEKKEPTALKICTLFINTEEEDRSVITPDMMSEKINDWKIEGYDAQSFFSLALNTVNGFTDIYNEMLNRFNK